MPAHTPLVARALRTGEVQVSKPRRPRRPARDYTEEAIRRDERPEKPQPTYECTNHGDYWPLFRDEDANPVCPWCVVGDVLSGKLRIHDLDKANADYVSLAARAGLTGHGARPYLHVLHAEIAHRNDEARGRLGERDFAPWAPELLTSDEVAAILKVDKQTVLRQQGQSLPAGIKIGGQWRFRADALAAVLMNRTTPGQVEGAVEYDRLQTGRTERRHADEAFRL